MTTATQEPGLFVYEPDPNPYGLASRAMLCKLKIKQWSAKKNLPRAAREAAIAAGADPNLVTLSTRLAPKETLEPIAKLVREIREIRRQYTLPWGDEGDDPSRIVAITAVDCLKAAAEPLITQDFPKLVDDFCANYAAILQDAPRFLGNWFQPRWYPRADAIRARFSVHFQIVPIPTPDHVSPDLRLTLGDAEVDRIKDELRADIEEAPRRALEEIAERIEDRVSKMAERLTAYKPASHTERASGVFRDSLTENIEELAAILPHINIFSDPRIDDIARRIKANLLQFQPETLRTNPQAREMVRQEARRIMDEMRDLVA